MPGAPAVRPSIRTDRWAEDWSVLADPSLRTGPFDAGKLPRHARFGVRSRFQLERPDWATSRGAEVLLPADPRTEL